MKNDVEKIQEGVQILLNRVRNDVNLSSPSIYMVPRALRDLNESCFQPRVVSIGPLHREDENLIAFEKHKATFLRNLLSRIDSPEHVILENCMRRAYASMERIKACYVWTETYNEDEVAKMMVMDACFILEFMYWLECSNELKCSNELYPGINLRPKTILSDLVLLENQLPFFFLDEIHRCTIFKTYTNKSLIEHTCPLLTELNIYSADLIINNISVDTTHHILSLLHQCYKPPHGIFPKDYHPSPIHSAVDLHRAGVNFKPYNDKTWMMMMKVKPYKFPYLIGSWGKPTLRMPELRVNDFTELIFRNLIAYEQSDATHNHIASYVWAMDMLVNTKEDVAKLVDSEVLLNDMGSNEDVVNIINKLNNGLVLDGFFYEEQWKTLYDYTSSYWPKHISWLRRTYFNSPWNIIALFVGIILFALTVVQTIFTIKSAR